MDAVLIACMEKNLSSRNVFRETAIREDTKNLTLNPLLQGYIHRYRENLGIAALAAYLRQYNIPTKIINFSILIRVNQIVSCNIIDQATILIKIIFPVFIFIHSLISGDMNDECLAPLIKIKNVIAVSATEPQIAPYLFILFS